ncbi:MAG: hypothetical protein IT280_13410 [Ignavibacteria bacterium]|nr:hypothetical protein [Ignavibacteria bacterium]
MKTLALILLLIISAGSLNNKNIRAQTDSTGKQHCFTDEEVRGIAKAFKENEFLKKDNADLTEENNTLTEIVKTTKEKLSLVSSKLEDAMHINELKEKMIRELENKPAVITNNTKWWVFAAIIVGSISTGFVIGKVAK